MRRVAWFILIVLTCAVAGALASGAVAIGLALWVPVRPLPDLHAPAAESNAQNSHLVAELVRESDLWERPDARWHRACAVQSRGFGYETRYAQISVDLDPHYGVKPGEPIAMISTIPRETGRYELSFGWPWRCVRARHTIEGYMPSLRPVVVADWAPAVAAPAALRPAGLDLWGFTGVTERPLPTGVLWRGFAANSAAYGGAMGLLGVGWVFGRRWWRVRRGRCRWCAYDLSATPGGGPCPECGRSSVRRAGTPGVQE